MLVCRPAKRSNLDLFHCSFNGGFTKETFHLVIRNWWRWWWERILIRPVVIAVMIAVGAWGKYRSRLKMFMMMVSCTPVVATNWHNVYAAFESFHDFNTIKVFDPIIVNFSESEFLAGRGRQVK